MAARRSRCVAPNDTPARVVWWLGSRPGSLLGEREGSRRRASIALEAPRGPRPLDPMGRATPGPPRRVPARPRPAFSSNEWIAEAAAFTGAGAKPLAFTSRQPPQYIVVSTFRRPLHLFEGAAGAERDARECVFRDHHGQSGRAAQHVGHAVQQGAAAGQHDALVDDVGGEFGWRVLECHGDRLDDLADGFGTGFRRSAAG